MLIFKYWQECYIWERFMSEKKKYEYIKWFWKYIDDETPVLLFYEVDLENERYALSVGCS